MNRLADTNKLKQPQGLGVFCLSTFFEKYAFYLVQALLVLYLVNFLHSGEKLAYSVLGSFIALSYVMPLIGGYIADRYWGLRRSIYIGALLEGVGFLLLIIPTKFYLVLGLSVISAGMGLFMPCVSSLLGFLYTKNDPRQDSGYTIFYVVFNGGVVLSTFLSGFLVRSAGWRVAFGTAALAITFTLVIFYCGLKKYRLRNLGPQVKTTFPGRAVAAAIILLSITLGFYILTYQILAVVGFIAACAAVVGIFIYCIINSTDEYQGKLVAFFILLIVSTIYWALYMQMFLSITLFIEHAVNKIFLGIDIPTPAFSSIEPFGVIIFGYPIAKLWIFLSGKNHDPSLPTKFSFGMVLLSVSFAVLTGGSYLAGSDGLVDPGWILIAYLILAAGELALSPIGLSMVNILTPPKFNAMMMGIFLLTIGLGGEIAGLLAQLAVLPEELTGGREIILLTYRRAFTWYLIISVVCTILALALIPYIKKQIGR